MNFHTDSLSNKQNVNILINSYKRNLISCDKKAWKQNFHIDSLSKNQNVNILHTVPVFIYDTCGNNGIPKEIFVLENVLYEKAFYFLMKYQYLHKLPDPMLFPQIVLWC